MVRDTRTLQPRATLCLHQRESLHSHRPHLRRTMASWCATRAPYNYQ